MRAEQPGRQTTARENSHENSRCLASINCCWPCLVAFCFISYDCWHRLPTGCHCQHQRCKQPSSPPVDCCLPRGCCIRCEASVAATAVAPALWLFTLPDTVAGTLAEWLRTPALFLQPLPPPISEVGNFSVYSFTWLTVMRLTRASYVKSRNSNIQKNKKADGLGQQNWQLTTTFLMNTVH